VPDSRKLYNMAVQNYRLINIDAFDPESSTNFPLSTLTPALAPVSASEVQTLAGQVRQLLRGGDTEGALRGALENIPYGGDDQAKEVHLSTVLEVLQSIKASEMAKVLGRLYGEPGGTELIDGLMKYL
jgi:actin related protein 2/3 complex subunit 5